MDNEKEKNLKDMSLIFKNKEYAYIKSIFEKINIIIMQTRMSDNMEKFIFLAGINEIKKILILSLHKEILDKLIQDNLIF